MTFFDKYTIFAYMYLITRVIGLYCFLSGFTGELVHVEGEFLYFTDR